jgi:hypothetical protein
MSSAVAEKALHHRTRGKDGAAPPPAALVDVDEVDPARAKMPPYQAAGYGKVRIISSV